MKRVRMLTDWEVEGLTYRCDQVVDFPGAVARDLVNLGAADASDEAIAFALDERKGEVLVHVSEAERAARAAVKRLQGELDALDQQYGAEQDAEKRAELGKKGDALLEQLAAAKVKLEEVTQG